MKIVSLKLVVLTLSLSALIVSNQSCKKTDQFGETSTALKPGHGVGADKVQLSHTKKYNDEVATEWFTLLTEIARTKPYFNPQALRIFSYSGIALYESVLPGMPSYQSIFKHFTGKTISVDDGKSLYSPACANAAIARIASRIMQDYPTPNISALQALESRLNQSFGEDNISAEQLAASNAFGKYVADIIYDWSRTDGNFNANGTPALCPSYTPLGGPGNWEPTFPFYFPGVGNCQGTYRTFIPHIQQKLLPPPPPAYSTTPGSVFYNAAMEVFQRRNNITAAETGVFNNWKDAAPNANPLAHMLKIATDIIAKENLNLEDAAVLYAKLTIATADNVSAAFYAKFEYSLIRPITYIHNVFGEKSWNSIGLTPQTPSYPDEVSVTAASVVILENYFGTNYAFIGSVHRFTSRTWAYSSFDELVQDVVQARVSGGTIFRFAGDAGIIMGRKGGHLVDALPFKKP